MILARFAGTVEHLMALDVSAMAAWITAIDFRDWPQQRLNELRPAMVTDPAWRGFGAIAEPVVAAIMAAHFLGCAADQRMLSVVMPGHAIEPHTDSQPPSWLCRVHVPLTSNERSGFIVGGVRHCMGPGHAYRVNTEAVHAVENDGDVARIHFMFDVKH